MPECEERQRLRELHREALSELTAAGRKLIELAGCPEQVGTFDRTLEEYETLRKKCESLRESLEFHGMQHNCGVAPGGP